MTTETVSWRGPAMVLMTVQMDPMKTDAVSEAILSVEIYRPIMTTMKITQIVISPQTWYSTPAKPN